MAASETFWVFDITIDTFFVDLKAFGINTYLRDYTQTQEHLPIENYSPSRKKEAASLGIGIISDDVYIDGEALEISASCTDGDLVAAASLRFESQLEFLLKKLPRSGLLAKMTDSEKRAILMDFYVCAIFYEARYLKEVGSPASMQELHQPA